MSSGNTRNPTAAEALANSQNNIAQIKGIFTALNAIDPTGITGFIAAFI
jgi:hypothetical protein